MTAETPARRIADMSALLARLLAALEEQAEFFRDANIEFGLESVAEGARLAARRTESADHAGAQRMHEMEKTVLVELCRSLLVVEEALRAAGREAWPDLQPLLARGMAMVREAARERPVLLWPAAIDPDIELTAGQAVAFGTSGEWHALHPGFVRRAATGVVLSVLPLGAAQKRVTSWMARVGGVGVAVLPAPEAAALAAEAGHATLFDETAPDPAPVAA